MDPLWPDIQHPGQLPGDHLRQTRSDGQAGDAVTLGQCGGPSAGRQCFSPAPAVSATPPPTEPAIPMTRGNGGHPPLRFPELPGRLNKSNGVRLHGKIDVKNTLLSFSGHFGGRHRVIQFSMLHDGSCSALPGIITHQIKAKPMNLPGSFREFSDGNIPLSVHAIICQVNVPGCYEVNQDRTTNLI